MLSRRLAWNGQTIIRAHCGGGGVRVPCWLSRATGRRRTLTQSDRRSAPRTAYTCMYNISSRFSNTFYSLRDTSKRRLEKKIPRTRVIRLAEWAGRRPRTESRVAIIEKIKITIITTVNHSYIYIYIYERVCIHVCIRGAKNAR